MILNCVLIQCVVPLDGYLYRIFRRNEISFNKNVLRMSTGSRSRVTKGGRRKTGNRQYSVFLMKTDENKHRSRPRITGSEEILNGWTSEDVCFKARK